MKHIRIFGKGLLVTVPISLVAICPLWLVVTVALLTCTYFIGVMLDA